MTKIVQFDPDIHMKDYRQMNIDYTHWMADQFRENYNIDLFSMVGKTAHEMVDNPEGARARFTTLKPPDGILLIVEDDGQVAGMGAVRMLSDEAGEIKRMYNDPQYRGRGYGRLMLNKLLEVGRDLGCSSFFLNTPKFAVAAQGLYRSAGFVEQEQCAPIRSMTSPTFEPYVLYMEKKE